MGTFSEEEHGEDLWKFNISKGEWESLTTKGEKPVQRSFHVMVIKDVSHSLPSVGVSKASSLPVDCYHNWKF